MTTFATTSNRTICLPSPSCEYLSAYWASFLWPMTNSFMIAFNATCSAQLRPPRSFIATLFTMFREFCGGRKLPAVYGFMTKDADGKSIVDTCNKFRVISNWLYVVCVQLPAVIAAFLACVFISGIYSFAPFLEIAFGFCAFAVCCVAALPRGGKRANEVDGSPFVCAWLRAKKRISIVCQKLSSAFFAFLALLRVAFRPAFSRAVVSGAGAISFYLKRLIAELANVCDLSVAHIKILTNEYVANIRFSALERWSTATGKIPELIL